MKRVEVYKSDDGQLETLLDRAKAHDLVLAISTARTSEPGPSSLKTGQRIDWHVAMDIMKYADIVLAHIQEYKAEKELRDAP